jgi:hypothetical protein
VPTSLSDLVLAYRQAKATLFFDRRGVGLSGLAEFENDLEARLVALRAQLRGGDGWFGGLPLGRLWVVPKRIRSEPESATEIPAVTIGIPDDEGPNRDLDVQVRLTPSPELAIVEVLYLWRFGPLLDSVLPPEAVGYRLDLRGGSLSQTRRWLFEYWPTRYEEFRTRPLDAARSVLKQSNQTVVITSADLATFYDTVNPAFLLTGEFWEEATRVGASADRAEFVAATKSLLGFYSRFRIAAGRLTGVRWQAGLPIGAITSRVVANASLATLDRRVTTRPEVIAYRRYVDDIVVVSVTGQKNARRQSADDVVRGFFPILESNDGAMRLNSDALSRAGSEFSLQKQKVRVHFLAGVEGLDFIAAIEDDFKELVSERRSFLDPAVLMEDAASRLIRARQKQGTPLRVLRDADRAKLEHFAVSNTLRSLERISQLVSADDARDHCRMTLSQISRFLAGDPDWVGNMEVAFRLLRVGVGSDDWRETRKLVRWMNRQWGTVHALRSRNRGLFYRDRRIEGGRAWVAMRNYLHERRIQSIAGAVRRGRLSKLPTWIRAGGAGLSARRLTRLTTLLAAADLRARDREDDLFGGTKLDEPGTLRISRRRLKELWPRLRTIERFTRHEGVMREVSWSIDPLRLFLCTRPPSYFDVSRIWLDGVDREGFRPGVFDEVVELVNGIRGSEYTDPAGRVLGPATVEIPAGGTVGDALAAASDPLLILGNLRIDEAYFEGATTKVPGSAVGRPRLTIARLRDLAEIIEDAETKSTRNRQGGPALLVLPELALPRQWFRAIAQHVVRFGEFGLVAGLEYLHHESASQVKNQAYAVFPGPFFSALTWPWTKGRPAREEGLRLAALGLSFPVAGPSARSVVHSRYGHLSVLICSELIEARLASQLLGRVELVLVPSWNTDTSSYDQLIQSVAFQLHAVLGIANNAEYSDCRAWAPREERWERDLCRLIQRDIGGTVCVKVPLRSLRSFHAGTLKRRAGHARPEWKPLPPDWP